MLLLLEIGTMTDKQNPHNTDFEIDPERLDVAENKISTEHAKTNPGSTLGLRQSRQNPQSLGNTAGQALKELEILKNQQIGDPKLSHITHGNQVAEENLINKINENPDQVDPNLTPGMENNLDLSVTARNKLAAKKRFNPTPSPN
jgi:hypothetical protein